MSRLTVALLALFVASATAYFQDGVVAQYGVHKVLQQCLGADIYATYQQKIAEAQAYCAAKPVSLEGFAAPAAAPATRSNPKFGNIDWGQVLKQKRSATVPWLDAERVSQISNDMLAVASNASCIYDKFGYIKSGKLDVEAVAKDVQHMPVDAALKTDLLSVVRYCGEQMACFDSGRLTGRIFASATFTDISNFMVCYNQWQVLSCMKHDLSLSTGNSSPDIYSKYGMNSNSINGVFADIFGGAAF